MANYKYENNNYYRQSSNGDWFKVDRDQDGYLTWTQPDGKQVYDKTFKVPAIMQVSKGPVGQMYTIGIGANGSIGRYYSFQDAVNAYTKAVNRGAFSDPSENILNDLMFDIATGKGAVSLATKGVSAMAKATPKVIKATPKVVKTALNAGKRLVTGQVTKEAAKQGAKKVAVAVAKEIPKIGVSSLGGQGVDKTMEALTGKSWGENVAEGLTNHYGFRVSPIVGEFTNPGYYIGYSMGNKGINNLIDEYRKIYPVQNATPVVEEAVSTQPIRVQVDGRGGFSSQRPTRAIEEPVEGSDLANALTNMSEEDLRAMLNRLRSEEVVTATSPIVQETFTPFQSESANILRSHNYTEVSPGVFNRFSRTIDLNDLSPRQAIDREGNVLQLNVQNPNDLNQLHDFSLGIRLLHGDDIQIAQTTPYVFKYRKDTPFTLETLPGLDRTTLVKPYDVTGMSHMPGEPILNSNGFVVGNLSNGKPYEQVMAESFNRIKHGASVGFDHSGATSTSSTPMFWLQLRRGLNNGSLARVYVPQNSPRYTLNTLGRAYQLSPRGRMVSVPGTEGSAFRIKHRPEFMGAKNIKNTLSDGSQINVVQLPDGTYLSNTGTVSDISQAAPLYYHNGAIYDGVTHKVIYSVDQPFLTRQQFVDHLNSEYIFPLAKQAGITIEPAEVISNGVFSKIEVPSIAGIKFKQGGSINVIDQFKRNRKCKKN